MLDVRREKNKQYILVPGKFEGYRSSRHIQGGEWFFDLDEKNKILFIAYEGWGERYSHGQRFGFIIFFDKTVNEFVKYRVSSKLASIDEALEFLIPAAVKKAVKSGKKVYRCGNKFYVETKRGIKEYYMKTL
ncbi:hypothetical protein [Thermococcus sp. GR6]|uniref:hypothetical protein n=1 Tax=Thermococcus sp. GR6 TaxID=1638256 RepID=UPI001430AB92|nr:hypothetical protein [Thermococcus sp. GR6]NJE41854.1 hypothetical protein [Thermococcus sp. GR6]